MSDHPADPIGAVLRELLARQLEHWTRAALHRARRATFVTADAGEATVRRALAVFDDFGELLRGRQLTAVLLGPAATATAARFPDAPVAVYGVSGDVDALAVAVKAATAAGAPLLAYADTRGSGAPGAGALAAVRGGRPGELLLAGPAGEVRRPALAAAGFPLVAEMELVTGEHAASVAFATSSGKSVAAFKEAVWAVGAEAGVRYRDPREPAGPLLGPAPDPRPAALADALLTRLGTEGPATVTELRRFAVTETVYRAADVNQVVEALVAAGALTRDPAVGRLGGDVLIGPA